jgi:hypothetical protein
MSDGITDSRRDNDLVKKFKGIRNLQNDFRKKESPGLAEQIVNELNELKNMPRGYWNSVNPQVIEQDIIKYQNYLNEQNYRGQNSKE